MKENKYVILKVTLYLLKVWLQQSSKIVLKIIYKEITLTYIQYSLFKILLTFDLKFVII